MTAVTIGHATATVQGVQATSAKPKSSIFARAWKAFVASRMQQAEREIALHRHLLPTELQDFDNRLARSEKDLPFVR
jgi:hypothetical protein